jgi:hypothetical protein
MGSDGVGRGQMAPAGVTTVIIQISHDMALRPAGSARVLTDETCFDAILARTTSPSLLYWIDDQRKRAGRPGSWSVHE